MSLFRNNILTNNSNNLFRDREAIVQEKGKPNNISI
jgi:hypothetical protein